MFPLQDTPSVKATYSAEVVTKNEFTPKMSANQTDSYALNDTHHVTAFHNSIPIPSYLIALVVGDLEYRSLGRRVGVITEPSQMDRVANELESLETLLDGAEDYLTRYIWGNYTIVVLPPSFPMGGMENPLLTFASPTIITGDKSQVYVATHEIAHSWTGNDVTCRNWEHFWLNEGFTVFNERHVSGKLYGTEFKKVESLLGTFDLKKNIENFGLNSTYSSLHPILNGDNPDNSFSEIPYEKGFQLLTYLESLIGEELMQEFLHSYILKYSQQSITSIQVRETWEEFIQAHFSPVEANSILSKVDWEAWLFKSGPSPVNLDFTTKQSNESAALANEYIKLQGKKSPDNFKDYFKFEPNLQVLFHMTLDQHKSKLNRSILRRIDHDLNVTATMNPEVKQRWYPLGLSAHYRPAYNASHDFVYSQGRTKYLTPIY